MWMHNLGNSVARRPQRSAIGTLTKLLIARIVVNSEMVRLIS